MDVKANSFQSVPTDLTKSQLWPHCEISKFCKTRAVKFVDAEIVCMISMAQGKAPITPILAHWSYCSLTLSHRYDASWTFLSQVADCWMARVWCSHCQWYHSDGRLDIHQSVAFYFGRNQCREAWKVSHLKRLEIKMVFPARCGDSHN